MFPTQRKMPKDGSGRPAWSRPHHVPASSISPFSNVSLGLCCPGTAGGARPLPSCSGLRDLLSPDARPPRTSERDLLWKEDLRGSNSAAVGSCWISMGCQPMTGVLVRRRQTDTTCWEGHVTTETEMGAVCYEPRDAKACHQPPGAREGPHLEPSGGAWPWRHLHVRQNLCVVWWHPVCNNSP